MSGICIGCKNYNSGEGTKWCLSCKKIYGLLPGVNRGKLKGEYSLGAAKHIAADSPDNKEVLGHRAMRFLEKSLSEREREAVVSVVIEEHTAREAAAELGISPQAVRTYLERGIIKLRKRMGLT